MRHITLGEGERAGGMSRQKKDSIFGSRRADLVYNGLAEPRPFSGDYILAQASNGLFQRTGSRGRHAFSGANLVIGRAAAICHVGGLRLSIIK